MEFRYRVWVDHGPPRTIRTIGPPAVDGDGGKVRRFRLQDGEQLVVPADTRYEEVPPDLAPEPLSLPLRLAQHAS